LPNGRRELTDEICTYNPESNGTSITTGVLGDSFSLVMADPAINTTDFIIFDDGTGNALWMRQGTGETQTLRKLTAPGLVITDGSFTKYDCINGSNDCRGVKIHLELKNVNSPTDLNTYVVEKTFNTTSKVRVRGD